MTFSTAFYRRDVLLVALCAGLGFGADQPAFAAETPVEPVHVNPGPVGGPPADAIVLFDGKDLAKWKGAESGDAKWKVENGYAEVNGTGSIITRDEFGDAQVHVEWATPAEVKGEGQGRGNSGVYLQARYEIQVLDSYENKTYPNGQAGALYGIAPPLVNASRKPGEWQTYDIIFHAPKKLADGKVEPGAVTVWHNGILIQDHTGIPGDATPAALMSGVAVKGPLMLQDHGNPVHYRNIWIRPLH
jgi:hypothetical protein